MAETRDSGAGPRSVIRLTLKAKLSLLITSLVAAAVLLVGAFLLRQQQQSLTVEMTKRGLTIAQNFGPTLAVGNAFKPGQSNCDFNGDGQIDFTQLAPPSCPEHYCEGACSNACDGDPACTEWTAYSARGEYKVSYFTCTGGTGMTCSMITTQSDCLATMPCQWTASTISPQTRRWLTRKWSHSQRASLRRSTSSSRFFRSPLSACLYPG